MKQNLLQNLLDQAWPSIQANQPNQQVRISIEAEVNKNDLPQEYKAPLFYYLGVLYYLENEPKQTLHYFGRALQSPNDNREFSREISQKYIILLEQFSLIEHAIGDLAIFSKSFPEDPWFNQKKAELEKMIEAQDYPVSSNVENWKKLQKDGYFDKHIHYQESKGLLWKGDDIKRISKYMNLEPEMTVAIIGCGYGRESALLSPLVKQIYGIDVDPIILNRAARELKQRNIANFTPVLFDVWKEKVPNKIDLVYCVTVFQHLTKHLVMDYLSNFSSKIAPGGHFICQFMSSAKTGSYDALCIDYEPHVSWTKQEIELSFDKVGLTINHIEHSLLNQEEQVYWYWVDAQKPE